MTANEQCRRWRELLGAQAMGRLTVEESSALQAHLDGCAACREEARSIAGAATALARAHPAAIDEPVVPPAGLADGIVAHVARSRTKTRIARLLAAALLAGTLATIGVFVAGGGTAAERVEFRKHPPSVRAMAVLEPTAWGTAIEIEVSGLEPGARYVVWLEEADGSHVPGGSFRSTGERITRIRLASALARSDTTGVGISDPEGNTILYAWV